MILLPDGRRIAYSYLCKRCDVYGFGTECWLCGKHDEFDINRQPKWTAAMYATGHDLPAVGLLAAGRHYERNDVQSEPHPQGHP